MSMGDQYPLSPKLPDDVVLYVIETVLAERIDSPECIGLLRTFSLVSRRYVPFCQRHLFKRYIMASTNSETRLSILRHSPHLIPYVQEVWMYLGRQGVINVTEAETEVLHILTSLRHLSVTMTQTSKWSTEWDELSHSIRRTICNLLLRPQMTSFALTGVEAPTYSLLATWCHIKSVDIRYANINSCFTHVDYAKANYTNADSDDESLDDDYTDIDFSRLSLTSSRAIPENSVVVRLEDLSLIDSDTILLFMLLNPDNIFEDECDISIFAPPSRAARNPNQENVLEGFEANRELDVNYDSPDNAHFSFNQLRSFTVDITANNLLPAWQLIHEARKSLTILDIRQRFRHKEKEDPFGFDSSLLPDHSPINLPQEVSLSPLLNLQKLSITILVLQGMPTHPNTLSSWCSLLRTVPHSIHTLEITLDAFYFNTVGESVDGLLLWFPNPDEDDGGVANSPFGSLDEIISSPVYFPSLERIIFRVDLPEYQEVSGSERGMTVDVVSEEDMTRLDAWIEEYGLNFDTWERQTCSRTPSSEGMAVDVVADEDLAAHDPASSDFEEPLDDSESSSTDSDSSYIQNAPLFSGDESMWYRSHLIPFERVKESISWMLHLTGKRFRPTNSFVVEVDFGVHMHK